MVQSQLIRKLSGLTRALVRPRKGSPPPRAPRALLHPYIKRTSNFGSVVVAVEDEAADDVIDLGAPRAGRAAPARSPREPRPRRQPYTPNPRLYPGPQRNQKRSVKRGGRSRAASGQRVRRRPRVFRRPVPNARLYRPAPPRPAPPRAAPRATWPPPPPPARVLDTASRAALRLSERPPPPSPPVLRERQLVVTLPGAGDSPARRYRPASEHFRLHTLAPDAESGACPPPPPARAPAMAAPRRHSASPEDCSEGNSLSAPSEFLAEFLSAIMRRQYAEALKYCRLILQYEPHNATARGFYPLLRQKAAPRAPAAAAAAAARNRSGSSSSSSGEEPAARRAALHDEVMEQEADSLASSSSAEGLGVAGVAGAARAPGVARRSASSGSVASQSSLELDSSPELSRRSDPDRDPDPDPDRTDSAAASASGSGWSSGSAPSSGRDGNGNPAPASPPAPPAPAATCAWDEENNAPPPRRAAPRPPPLQSEESASLRRLRAQFACSIK